MKKEIRDYLHFYLGCQCYTKRHTEIDNISRVGTFIGFVDEYKLSIRLKFRAGPEGRISVFFIKPILRSLSDMTEDEAIEFAKLTEWEPHFTEVEVSRNKLTNDIIVSWQGSNEGRETVNATGDLFYCSEQFQWLLSKHFDLFGLIEAGLAIDSTTLK